MKQILSSILLFFASHAMIAQDLPYRPLVEEGKRWTYDNYLDFRPDEYNHYYWYYLKGDTIINGKTCLKMFSENEYNDDKIIYKGALYEENRKVYFVNDVRKFTLLYDFGGMKGDEIMTEEGLFTVEAISTIENQEETFRMFELSSKELEDEPDAEYMHVFWIEGVGCTKDFFAMIPYPGNYCSLVRCEVNGEVLYQYIQPKYTDEGYHEMAIEGKTWNYIHHYEDENGVHEEPYSYVVKGDTVIGRTKCKKLYYQDSQTERFVCTLFEMGRDFMKLQPGSRAWRSPYQFGRTDFGRVFDWDSKQGAGRVFWMLHDRDTITVNGTDYNRLTFYSKTIVGGTTGMLATIEDGADVWHEIWVEGVGSELNGIEDPVHERPLNDKDYTRFVSCYENGICIFTANDFTTTSITSPSSLNPQPSTLTPWYSLSGRSLTAPPTRPGLYIKDGHKVLIK